MEKNSIVTVEMWDYFCNTLEMALEEISSKTADQNTDERFPYAIIEGIMDFLGISDEQDARKVWKMVDRVNLVEVPVHVYLREMFDLSPYYVTGFTTQFDWSYSLDDETGFDEEKILIDVNELAFLHDLIQHSLNNEDMQLYYIVLGFFGITEDGAHHELLEEAQALWEDNYAAGIILDELLQLMEDYVETYDYETEVDELDV